MITAEQRAALEKAGWDLTEDACIVLARDWHSTPKNTSPISASWGLEEEYTLEPLNPLPVGYERGFKVHCSTHVRFDMGDTLTKLFNFFDMNIFDEACDTFLKTRVEMTPERELMAIVSQPFPKPKFEI